MLSPFIRNQLSLPPAVDNKGLVEWQLLEAHVWGMLPYAAPVDTLTASDLITVGFMDLQGGDPGYQNTGAVLFSASDDCSGANRARVGFRWPSATQTDVFWLGSDYRRLIIFEGPVVRIHFKIRWRMRGYSAGAAREAILNSVPSGEQGALASQDEQGPPGGDRLHTLPPGSDDSASPAAINQALTSLRR